MLFGFTLATLIWDWYATDNSFLGTPRGNRKKLMASRSPTGRLSTAAMCRGVEMNGMVGAGHGRVMASVNQTRPRCVNQMGKTHYKPLATRHDRGTAWARHAMCESAFIRPRLWPSIKTCHHMTQNTVQTRPSTPLQYRVAYQNINLTPSCVMLKQPSFYLCVINNQILVIVLLFYFTFQNAGRSGRAVYGRSPAEIVGSNPTGAWLFVCCECCQVEVSATDWSLVQTSLADCGASLCVIKKPRIRGG
jgi:hypothetical protein